MSVDTRVVADAKKVLHGIQPAPQRMSVRLKRHPSRRKPNHRDDDDDINNSALMRKCCKFKIGLGSLRKSLFIMFVKYIFESVSLYRRIQCDSSDDSHGRC